jgi:hypothetical protein
MVISFAFVLLRRTNQGCGWFRSDARKIPRAPWNLALNTPHATRETGWQVRSPSTATRPCVPGEPTTHPCRPSGHATHDVPARTRPDAPTQGPVFAGQAPPPERCERQSTPTRPRLPSEPHGAPCTDLRRRKRRDVRRCGVGAPGTPVAVYQEPAPGHRE